MSLLKKRARVGSTNHQSLSSDNSSGAVVAASNNNTPTLERVNSLFTSVIDQVKTSAAAADGSAVVVVVPDVRSTVLQLGEWQRHLYETVAQQETAIAALTAAKLKASRTRMAAAYERAHLQREIAQCQQNATTGVPHLEQLAREETGNNKKKDAAASTTMDVVSSFLGVAVDDPHNKAVIVAKLQECLKQRALLEKEVSIKKQALLKTQQELKAKRDLLHSLPAHVQAMERASQQGLVKFMNHHAAAAAGGSHGSAASIVMTGKERLARLELAQQLPAPLYTLYSLLQHYVDETATAKLRQTEPSAADPEDGTMKLTVVKSSSGAANDEVVWQLPVADVGTAAKKRVSIHFVYNDSSSTPVPVVTVRATGCATTLNQDVLLGELFPGDFALETTSSSSSSTLKSYQWSNHLAGLYPIPASAAVARTKDAPSQPSSSHSFYLNVSTRVVVHELQRRIRANATLKHMLYSLQRHHVPVPPPVPSITATTATATAASALQHQTTIASHFDMSWKPLCKLVKFDAAVEDRKNDDTSTNTTTTTFQVELRKGIKSLQATVRIQTTRYPAVPPVWSFQADNKEIGKSALYDTRLAQLAQKVNVEALGRMTTTTSASSEDTSRPAILVVDEAKLQYYEWILVHQLREIMLDWDTWTEENSVLATIGRKRKGRERRIV